ncbi:MAG: diguanylate cyclase [Lachnospiraceae bacterium]|nr:diguanylate cyclase [Lachnospiraceae bacterium]
MYYASFGVLSLILHHIINLEIFRKCRRGEGTEATICYRNFLSGVMIYYTSDILWGILYEWDMIPLVYADTVLYFVSMVLSVFLWTRFVIVYLDRKGTFGKILTAAGCLIFGYQILNLAINFFHPIVFSFNANDEYVPMTARFITLVMQVLLYLVTSVYTLVVSAKTEGKEKIHNRAVGVSGVVMAFFIILQTLFPLLPFYAVGCLIGTCLVHTFVAEDERMEHARKLGDVMRQAECVNQRMEEVQKKRVTFGKIAESLALNYDVIFYVNTQDCSYTGYSANSIYGGLEVKTGGEDFFADSRNDLRDALHPQDREHTLAVLDRDYLLASLEKRRQFSIDYRLCVGDKAQYTRLIARKVKDASHFIICVENIDEEVRKEKEHLRALNTEKELARRDELTGTKNKNAYTEYERLIQEKIDKGEEKISFAIAICDINDLKKINDTRGHKAGDDYIKAAAKLLCGIFAHSPVFRIGGDEFLIFMQNDDYTARKELFAKLEQQVDKNRIEETGPVIASGMAEYEPTIDRRVSSVFERADNLMYDNKRQLKAVK